MWHVSYTSKWTTHYGDCVWGWHCTLILINTLQNKQLSWDGGDWRCNTDDSCPFGSLSADWTVCCCCTVNKRLQLLHQSNRQLMQIQKLVLDPKFGAHIVEKSNDQGLNTVFMSPRTSCLRQKTSCTVLIDKVKHFYFCCIICEFLLF